ncbi:hypothetical protein K2X92_05315 [Candidatus Gracilibacteria bacterium]|nr:hypothetical protein [Candidatus Gracilibacteria bacterium]
MQTKTLTPIPESKSITDIANIVDERGFYLHEWISSDELQMTLEKDYLQIVKASSIPLAIITIIAGFIGFSGGPIGTMIAVLAVLGVFYTIVSIILLIKFLYRSYIYTRGANVVITDNHYVSGGTILEQSDTESTKNAFKKIETIFDEPFLGESKLEDKKIKAKTELFESLKEVAMGGGKILQQVGRSKDSGGIVIVVLVAGFLYAAMMAIVYFIGIFFISLFGKIFSGLAHQYLLMTSNTEHKIQTLFGDIQLSSDSLREGQKTTVTLLHEAGRDEWKENLSGKIGESLELINSLASNATDKSIELRKILESSEYKDIFNFIKYGNWIKTQILEPIDSILTLIKKNHKTLQSTIDSIEEQILNTTEKHLKSPLLMQKDRLILQVESFSKIEKILNEYKEKLTVSK